ncbi:MAG: HEAT repeat domain-containing protein [Nitrospirae bacterium]|nr:HEAT repeat domain-containing protein [Nitrospirota bacterium]
MNSIRLEDPKDQEQEQEDKKDSIRLATEVLQTFSKAIKTLRLYPDTSPLRQKFVAELTEKFTRFLYEYGDMTLKVKQSELLYEGEVVYSQPSKEESIAFKLYGDGIRELIFTEGLNEPEILAFIDVIRGDYAGEEVDDDIVTILWEKNFKNILYTVVEGGEDGEGHTAIPEKHVTAGTNREAIQMAYKTEVGGEPQGNTLCESAGVELEIEHIYGKPFIEIFILTPEEIEKVQQEMEMEEGMDLISELLDILFHILQIERELDSYSEIMKNIGRALKTLILSGDYRRVTPILTTLKTLSKDENNMSTAHAQEVQKAIDAFGEEEFLHQLTLSVNVNKVDDLDALSAFLTMLNRNAIVPLSSMMGTLDQMKTRRLFCDALSILAKDDIDPLLKKLEDNNWYVVRNIVYILGKIRDPKAVHYLKKIKDHEEPRVRKEIVHTLTEIKSEEAKDLLINFLNDSNNAVRITTLRNLVTLCHQKAVSTILNIISSDTFDSKEVYEKKEFFETLGRLGSRDILPYLKETLMKRTWLFGKTKVEEMRVYAARALKSMPTPEALDILREGISLSDKGIQKICEDTLQEIEKEKR